MNPIQEYVSTRPAEEMRFDLTLFDGAYQALPLEEVVEVPLDRIVQVMAPHSGPVISRDKFATKYALPCLLREAPFVGKTAERAVARGGTLIGKQRSAAHVTTAAYFPFDLDDIETSQFERILNCLTESTAKFVIYSTYSNGQVEGQLRVRVLLFLDESLGQTEFTHAWDVCNEVIFESAADKKTRQLCQLAGVWTSHPDRSGLAFRREFGVQLLSARRLLQAWQACAPSCPSTIGISAASINQDLIQGTGGALPDAARLRVATLWIDPNDYDTWTRHGVYLKALVPAVGEVVAFTIWLEYSMRGNQQSKANNAKDSYNPEVMWVRFRPNLSPEAAAGSIFALARNSVLQILADQGKPLALRQQALTYLARYHRRLFSELKQAA